MVLKLIIAVIPVPFLFYFSHYLLSDGASRASKVIAEHKPLFASAREYLDYIDSICTSGDRITYTDEGATVRL